MKTTFKPWKTETTYVDLETGEQITDMNIIINNYSKIKTTKNVKTTDTNRIVERTIELRKREYKQGELF